MDGKISGREEMWKEEGWEEKGELSIRHYLLHQCLSLQYHTTILPIQFAVLHELYVLSEHAELLIN